jgi:hypothetical protein
MHGQTLIPQPAVERFNEGIFDGFAWPDEVQLDPASIRSVFKRPRLKLRAVIDGDRARPWRSPEDAIQRRADGDAGHARGDLQHGTLATPLIDHSQDPKRPTVSQRVMHEVHAPALAGAGRHGRGPFW